MPSGEAEEELKEELYNSLLAIVETIPKHYSLLNLGGFKAKLGEENEGRRRNIETESTGEKKKRKWRETVQILQRKHDDHQKHGLPT